MRMGSMPASMRAGSPGLRTSEARRAKEGRHPGCRGEEEIVLGFKF
jgi:hypothetical protein